MDKIWIRRKLAMIKYSGVRLSNGIKRLVNRTQGYKVIYNVNAAVKCSIVVRLS
jgi:hypothetical protein